MIHTAIKIISDHLEDYIAQKKNANDGIVAPYVVLGNISRMMNESSDITNKIVLSLINLNQDKILKPTFPYEGSTDMATQANPSLLLDLLFSENFNNYEISLKYLSWIIEFFHGKSNFNMTTSNMGGEASTNYKIIIELYSLSFEQLSYLWSSLGIDQRPSVCYKARIIPLPRN